jgi:hypothetical protein
MPLWKQHSSDHKGLGPEVPPQQAISSLGLIEFVPPMEYSISTGALCGRFTHGKKRRFVPVRRDVVQSGIDQRIPRQVSRWWDQARVALRSGQLARAQRFIRWTLAFYPDDEEAWLWLARLASHPGERMAYLRQAYRFHPESPRVQTELRQARKTQLQSSVGHLKPRRALVRCLPDARQQSGGASVAAITAQQPYDLLGQSMVRLGHTVVRGLATVSLLDPVAFVAFVVPLVTYLLTACSTVYNLDSAEFSTAAHVLGIVRATGYPLYLLIAKAFTLVMPLGDIGFRLNVMSALCAAGTVALLYHLLQRLTQQRAAALAASLLFAFSYYLWAQAVVAEVYTLHTLLLAALLVLLIRWEARRTDGLLAAIGLLYGLSFGNHMSTLLLAPGLVAFLLAVQGREILRVRRLALMLIPFVIGLGVYAYLPLRYLAEPAYNYAGKYDATGRFIPLDMTRPANLWWLISGQEFRSLMFSYTLPELWREIGTTAHRLWGSFLGLGLVPGLLGAWIQLRRNRQRFLLFSLVFVMNMIFFVNYRVVDKEAMFVPAYLVWAVWIGEGFAALTRWVQGRRQIEECRSPAWAWGFVALATMALLVNWPLVDVHGDIRARDHAEAALSQAQPNAIILGWWTSAPPLQYLQIVEGQRPDVLIINRFLIEADEMYALIDHSLGHQPVYVMELDEGLVGAYQAIPVGPMFELAPREVAEVRP